MKPAFRRTLLCFLTAALFLCSDAEAQDEEDEEEDVVKISRYIVVVEHKNGQAIKGVLHSIDEIEITLMNFRRDSIIYIPVPAGDVTQIRYRKEGKIRRHALVGLGIGVGIGAILGFATYDAHQCDLNTCVEKGVDPVTTSVLGGILGAGTGAILGARYTKINLEGDPKKYEAAISFFENSEH